MHAAHPETIHVRYEDGQLELTGPVSQRLQITAQAMLLELMDHVGSRPIDLICIAAGVYAVDRIVKRRTTAVNESGIRTFSLCFHVADVDYWRQPVVIDRIADVLHTLTGDNWIIEFVHHERSSRPAPQVRIDFRDAATPSRLALYSGGLDSAAGLANQLLEGQRDLMLLTVGHQSSIRRRCNQQVKSISRALPSSGPIYHAYFRVNLQRPERMRKQEASQRARGFLFCSSAAIFALAFDIHEIDVYENGPGAINLPLSSGALSGGFSTRGAHPGFLQKMSLLVSHALESEIRFNLPFLWQTKSAMVAPLARVPDLAIFAHQSHSCVHTSWREAGVSHCGRCPACLERYQAFASAGVTDLTSYSQKRLWRSHDPLKDDYMRLYLDNAKAWASGDLRQLSRLKMHCALSGIDEAQVSRIAAMCRQHAQEVLAVYGALPHAGPSGSTNMTALKVAA